MRIAVRRLERCLHGNPRFFQHLAQRRLPLLVAVTVEHPAPGQRSLIGGRHRAADLAHESLVRMQRTTNDLHAARREVDREQRVVRHPPAPRPHLGREEIRAGNRAPMRPQKRVPSCWPLWHRRNAPSFSESGRSSIARHDGPRFSGTADPGKAPRRVLFGHPHDQAPNLPNHPRDVRAACVRRSTSVR